MKKAKRLLALISSAVMIASIGAMSVSAGTTEKIIYNTDSNGHSYPVKQTVRTEYKGIIVTMPDGEAPAFNPIAEWDSAATHEPSFPTDRQRLFYPLECKLQKANLWMGILTSSFQT